MTDTKTDTQWDFSSTYVVLPSENVDTDQIIPARFLTTTDRTGLGPNAFNDWRYLADGSPNPEFVLNRPESKGAEVLVAGHNFGCGSSREHAVWALAGVGFRAVVSSTFADIFRGNALGNGLLPIEVTPDVLAKLMASHTPSTRVAVNLETSTLTLPDGETVTFPVPPFSKYCLLNGIDEMGFLLKTAPEVEKYESTRPSTFSTLGAAAAA
ncbi:MAG: 3-isopropylmalate dehydratase small subunit [Gemmatimonadaceae bacterium]